MSKQKPSSNIEELGDYFKTLVAEIPNYQRGYEWQEEQISDFLNDLFDESDNNDSKYFFGPVVVIDGEKKDQPKLIIDGQQRLTTVTIFVATLKEILEEFYPDDSEAEDFIGQIIEVYIGSGKSARTPYHLKQRGLIADSFTHLFQDFTEKDFRTKNTKNSSANNRLVRAHNIIKEGLINRSGVSQGSKNAFKKLEKYFNVLSDNFYIVEVSSSDSTDAFQIFQTLNGRGLDLTPSDLIKSDFFGKARKENEKVEKYWDNIQNTIGQDDLSDYIRYFWNATNPFVTKRNLSREVTKKNNSETKILKFMEELNSVAENYLEVTEPSLIANPLLKNVLVELNLLGFRAYTPIYLAANISKLDGGKIVKLMTIVEKYLIREKLAERVMNNAEKFIAKQAVSLYKNSDVDKTIEAFEMEMVNDRETKDNLVRYHYEDNKNIVRHIYRTIERSRRSLDSELEVKLDNNKVQIEHIMPVEGKKWDIDQIDHDDNIWELGNLTLLLQNINGSIGNEIFDKKKQEYDRSDLKITQELLDYSQWNIDEINERTERIIDEYIESFKL